MTLQPFKAQMKAATEVQSVINNPWCPAISFLPLLSWASICLVLVCHFISLCSFLTSAPGLSEIMGNSA